MDNNKQETDFFKGQQLGQMTGKVMGEKTIDRIASYTCTHSPASNSPGQRIPRYQKYRAAAAAAARSQYENKGKITGK